MRGGGQFSYRNWRVTMGMRIVTKRTVCVGGQNLLLPVLRVILAQILNVSIQIFALSPTHIHDPTVHIDQHSVMLYYRMSIQSKSHQKIVKKLDMII